MTEQEKLEKILLKSLLWELDENWIPVRVDIEATAKRLIENGVMREKSEWILNRDGSGTCKKCRRTTIAVWDFDNSLNFCPHCGADMRNGENG